MNFKVIKKLNILLLLILSLGSNAKNINSQNLTGIDYSLVNQSGSISVSLGVDLSLQPFHALNVTLPSVLYRFKASNTSGLAYFGGVGFPTGTTSSATNFINVPAGEYNIYLTGNTYSFVAVTTRMIVGNRFSYNFSHG